MSQGGSTSNKPIITPNDKIGLLLGGGLQIDTQPFSRSNNHHNDTVNDGDNFNNEMAKTSMFGGGHNLINSAELPQSPAGTRLQYKLPTNNENADPAGLSCYSVKGQQSSVGGAGYRSPSPSNKGTENEANAATVGMSFLERMAKQGINSSSATVNNNATKTTGPACQATAQQHHDPMAHTFSSLSPKNHHQVSAAIESKNMLNLAAVVNGGNHFAGADGLTDDQQSYINPFSIAACRKDSDQNTEGEVTAEGFYKIPQILTTSAGPSGTPDSSDHLQRQSSQKYENNANTSSIIPNSARAEMDPIALLKQQQEQHNLSISNHQQLQPPSRNAAQTYVSLHQHQAAQQVAVGPAQPQAVQQSSTAQTPGQSNGTQQQMSPFDVVLQEQQKHQQITSRKQQMGVGVVTPKISHDQMNKVVSGLNMGNGVPPITRHSNPMGQIQKLQIVSLGRGDSSGTTTNNGNLSSNNSIAANGTGAGAPVFKIKRSQIIAADAKQQQLQQPSTTANDNGDQLDMSVSGLANPKVYKQNSHQVTLKDSAIKFKKQFSRVSTGATMSSNSHNQPQQQPHQRHNESTSLDKQSAAYARLKSIEKINQERVHLIGLKSQSASKKVNNKEHQMDAFDVELKVINNEQQFGGGVPSLDCSVDNLRSIGSASMNKGISSNHHLQHNQNMLSSPLQNQQSYLLQARQQVTERSSYNHGAADPTLQIIRKATTKSRGNPFEPASPATSESMKLQLQGQAAAQAAYDRKQKFLQQQQSHPQPKLVTSHSHDRRRINHANQNSGTNMLVNQQQAILHSAKSPDFFSPNIGALKTGVRLNSESRRVCSENYQPFNNLFSQQQSSVAAAPADYLIPGAGLLDNSPRSIRLAGSGGGTHQSQIIGSGQRQMQTAGHSQPKYNRNGGQYDKQFGLFLSSEADPFPDPLTPNEQSQWQIHHHQRKDNQLFFNDLAMLNHSATQDNMGMGNPSNSTMMTSNNTTIPPSSQSASNQDYMQNNSNSANNSFNRRVSVHQIMQGNLQQVQQMRAQLQTREDAAAVNHHNYRNKISSQGLMHPNSGPGNNSNDLLYNTIEGANNISKNNNGNNSVVIGNAGGGQVQQNMSIDHFPPGPAGQHNNNGNSSFSGRLGGSNHQVVGGNYYHPASHHQQQATQPVLHEGRSSIGRSFDNYMNSQGQGPAGTNNAPNAQKSSGIRPVASKNIPQVFRQNPQQNHHRQRRTDSDPGGQVRAGVIASRGSIITTATTHHVIRQSNVSGSGAPTPNTTSTSVVGGAKTSTTNTRVTTSAQKKQRSFSNDARIMLHESKKYEHKIYSQAHHNDSIATSNNQMVFTTQMKAGGHGSTTGVDAVGQGLFSASTNNKQNSSNSAGTTKLCFVQNNHKVSSDFDVYDRQFNHVVHSAQPTTCNSKLDMVNTTNANNSSAATTTAAGDSKSPKMYETPSFRNPHQN